MKIAGTIQSEVNEIEGGQETARRRREAATVRFVETSLPAVLAQGWRKVWCKGLQS